MRKKSDYELIAENGGKYALVMGVTRRARELNNGGRALVEAPSLNSVATALEEVAQDRIRILAPAAPKKASPLRPIPELKRD
ncbi:MAG: DNA-directed RNA polymerase subunit omega [Fimbriimonadaceae bacterium]|nr:DNA-directed RNA polymerase subunit omega [Fimbriimonadaceae bacterium]